MGVDGSAWAGGGERGGKLPGDAGRNRVDFRHAMYPLDTADDGKRASSTSGVLAKLSPRGELEGGWVLRVNRVFLFLGSIFEYYRSFKGRIELCI